MKNNMENPAHVYTTGIPMSKKGKFAHIKNGCALDETLDSDSVGKIVHNGNLNDSFLNISNSTFENGDYINSIQDGFQQSEIMCGFSCDAGLQPEDLPMANSSLEVESITESDVLIKFPDSPGSSFSCKIEPFSSIEAMVPTFEAQLLDSYLSGFQKVNKSQSDDGGEGDEHRNVSDTISAIAESFGLEDLLPDNFQTHDNKDLPITVIHDSLCDCADNISDIPLVDFEKCSTIHSPGSSLDLGEQLHADSHVFGLDMLVSPTHSQIKIEEPSSKQSSPVKEDEKIFINSKDICNYKAGNNALVLSDDKVACELTFGDSRVKAETDKSKIQSCEFTQSNIASESSDIVEGSEELEQDIPTVRITDMQSLNSTEGDNCSSSGTVLITCDKASKKMQIVLTLEQGQQIFDIDTGSIDASEQSMDLGIQTVMNEEQIQEEEQNGVELISSMNSTELEQYTEDMEDGNQISLPDDEDTSFDPSNFVELVADFNPITVKKRRGRSFMCPTEGCGQILDKECKLRVHMLGHKLVTRPFKCDFEGCDWAFTTPYRLRRHAETHLGSKDYICDFEGCNRKFTTVYNLKTHIKRHKWANTLNCPSKDCNMSFSNRRRLELHLRVHKDVEAPYKCTICGKQYYSANCIASHVRTHQYSEDDFKCPFQDCGKVYDKICRLRQHIRYHTGDRPYACPAEGCHWSFMSASKLTRHMRKHTGERKFTCTEPGCGKSFMRPEHLKGHIVIHSGDKPFHCPHENCDARFTAKSSLYVHLKRHCPSVLKVVFYCPVVTCSKKYNTKSALKQHLQKHHPEIVDEWSEMSISEKLAVKVSESPLTANGTVNLEFGDDSFVDDPDDPRNLKVSILQSDDPNTPAILSLVPIGATVSSTSDSIDIKPVVAAKVTKNVPKASKGRSGQSRSSSNKSAKVAKISDKVVQENHSGCARTDYVCRLTQKAIPEQIPQPPSMSFVSSFNQNSIDSSSFLTVPITEIKSPDIMLTSYQCDQSSDQLLLKSSSSFLTGDESSNHESLYHHDDVGILSETFEDARLISSSLLSDSEESELNHSTGVNDFSEQNSVDAFAESIHLHGLD